MITQQEAEALAHTTIETYINRCSCKTIEEVGNALMKLTAMCGISLVATQGQAEAVHIVEAVKLQIAKPQFSKTVRIERVTKQ